MMASIELQEKANFTRLSRLLVDKGTEALRMTLDAIHPPVNLPAVLKANKKHLLKLRHRVISDSQWNLLFPPSGNPPDSKTFDVTLISVLLRNICRLLPPASGWNTMPPNTDNTREANITRIKLLRNQVYAHVTSTKVDQTTFDDLWQELSRALFHMKIPQKEIDDLKICPLGPEEEIYKQTLEEWVFKEKECKNMLNDVNNSIKLIKQQMAQLTLLRKIDREAIKESNQEIKALKKTVEQNRQEIQELRLSVSNSTSDQHPTQKSAEGKFRENSTDSVDQPLVQELGKNNFESKISHKASYFYCCTDDLGDYDDNCELYSDRDGADYDFVNEVFDFNEERYDYGDDCYDDRFDNCDGVEIDYGDYDHDDADDIDYNHDALDYEEADVYDDYWCDDRYDNCNDDDGSFGYGDLDRDDAADDYYDHEVPDYNEEYEYFQDRHDLDRDDAADDYYDHEVPDYNEEYEYFQNRHDLDRDDAVDDYYDHEVPDYNEEYENFQD